ncbi:MAG: RelA/SpoT family protein [Candidatus Gracilibacteria bacterium]|nr:RelA/SpoT family protein [Candidatus Gracilibacteria bacterium]
MSRIDVVIAMVREYLPEESLARIIEAYEFSEAAHRKHLRKSGEPYIIHPVEAARILATLRADENTIIAALLHDVPEDTETTLEEVAERFGEDVAYLVDGVTKLSKVHYQNRMEERQVASLRKMFLVMAKDVRVILIKLADRLHNMRTLQYVRADKQERIARETLEIYAPLANLLGVWQLRWPLEDYCFQYLFPNEYEKLKVHITETQEARANYVKQLNYILDDQLKHFKIKAEVEGRSKHLYSIYQKMLRENKEVEEIYDIFAMRVIVDTIDDCYRVLGLIHKLWHPKGGRFKDYIALPKPNGYRSLHTTVFGPKGKPTEFQIRTHEMHREAETGVATHLIYQSKQGRLPVESSPWVSNILTLHGAEKDNANFIEELKLDVFQDRIFVFTPKGDTIDLPKSATCLDFAYNVHTSLGNRARKARVNNEFVPLNSKLKLGDTVEIMGDNTKIGPKREWLDYVFTTQAKRAIRNWFRNETYARKIEIGNDLLGKELARMGRGSHANLSKKEKNLLLSKLYYKSQEELLAALGEGSLPLEKVIALFVSDRKHTKLKIFKSLRLVLKKIITHILPRAYEDSKRVRLKIVVNERIGLAKDITSTIAGMGLDIESLYIRKSFWDKNKGIAKLTLQLKNFKEIRQLCNNLEIYEDVKSVSRLLPLWQFTLFFWMLFTIGFWLTHPFLMRILEERGFHNVIISNGVLLFGMYLLFFVISRLKTFTKRSFPTFYGTKIFWIAALLMNISATITVLFELKTIRPQLSWILVFSLLLLLYLYLGIEYYYYRKDREVHAGFIPHLLLQHSPNQL